MAFEDLPRQVAPLFTRKLYQQVENLGLDPAVVGALIVGMRGYTGGNVLPSDHVIPNAKRKLGRGFGLDDRLLNTTFATLQKHGIISQGHEVGTFSLTPTSTDISCLSELVDRVHNPDAYSAEEDSAPDPLINARYTLNGDSRVTRSLTQLSERLEGLGPYQGSLDTLIASPPETYHMGISLLSLLPGLAAASLLEPESVILYHTALFGRTEDLQLACEAVQELQLPPEGSSLGNSLYRDTVCSLVLHQGMSEHEKLKCVLYSDEPKDHIEYGYRLINPRFKQPQLDLLMRLCSAHNNNYDSAIIIHVADCINRRELALARVLVEQIERGLAEDTLYEICVAYSTDREMKEAPINESFTIIDGDLTPGTSADCALGKALLEGNAPYHTEALALPMHLVKRNTDRALGRSVDAGSFDDLVAGLTLQGILCTNEQGDVYVADSGKYTSLVSNRKSK